MKHTCNYCNNETGTGYSFIARKYHPTIYKCIRWWCKLGRLLNILKLNIVPKEIKK